MKLYKTFESYARDLIQENKARHSMGQIVNNEISFHSTKTFNTTISELLLGIEDYAVQESDICIIYGLFLGILKRETGLSREKDQIERMIEEEVWPISLKKFVIGDANDNVILCYFYEIDEEFPKDLMEGKRIKIFGSYTQKQPFDEGFVLLAHKIETNLQAKNH